MPKPYPKEFREDVVRVARSREAGVTLAQVAKDFGIHEMTLNKWWIAPGSVESGLCRLGGCRGGGLVSVVGGFELGGRDVAAVAM